MQAQIKVFWGPGPNGRPGSPHSTIRTCSVFQLSRSMKTYTGTYLLISSSTDNTNNNEQPSLSIYFYFFNLGEGGGECNVSGPK
jgi:hypothetical protein